MDEGIVPGGGASLIHLSPKVAELRDSLTIEEEKIGADIVLRAIQAPLAQIAKNAGVEGAIVVAKVQESDANIGYNALTGQYEDLIASGIIDPAKVVRTSLQNAASIAGLVLTTEALVVEKPAPEPAMPDMGGMGGGMPGMGGMGMPGMGMM